MVLCNTHGYLRFAKQEYFISLGMNIIRTTSTDSHFVGLVALLDRYLAKIDGEEHGFYAQFNKIDHLQHVIVAIVNDKPAGCGAFKKLEENTIEIKRMYVPEEFRRQKIASAVLEALEKWGAELGFTKAVLETGIRQPDAIAFYLKCGYHKISNYGQYIGVSNSVCFEKIITY